MSDNIIKFPGDTTAPVEPDEVLEEMKGKCAYVLVIGWGPEEEGMPLIAGSSSSDLREAFYAIENYKFATMQMKWEE